MSTRNICTTLKIFTERVDKKMAMYEKEKSRMKTAEQKQKNMIIDLEKKFSELEITCVNNKDELVHQLDEERFKKKAAMQSHEMKEQELVRRLQVQKDTIVKKNEFIEEMKKGLDRKENELRQKHHEHDKTLDQLRDVETELQSNDIKFENYVMELDELKKRAAATNVYLNDARQQLQDAKMKEDRLTKYIEEQKYKHDSDMRALKALSDMQQTEIQQQKERIQMYQQDVQQRQAKITELISIKETITVESREVSTAKEQLVSEKSALQSEISEMRDRYKRLCSMLTDGEEQVAKLMEERTQLQEKLNAMKHYADSAADDYESRGKKLEDQLSNADKKNCDLIEQVKQFEKQETSLRSELELEQSLRCEEKQQLEKLQNDLTEKQNEISTLRDDLATYAVEVDNYRQQVEKANSSDATLQKKQQELTDEVEQLRTKHSIELKDITEEVISLRNAAKAMKEEIEGKKEIATEHKKKMTAACDELKRLRQELLNKTRSIDTLTAQVQDLDSHCEIQRVKQTDMEQTIELLRSKLSHATDNAGTIQAKIDKYKEEILGYEENMIAKTFEISKARKEINIQTAECKKLRNEIQKQAVEHKETLQQKTKLEKGLEDLKQQFENKGAIYNKEKQALEGKNAEMNELTTETKEKTCLKKEMDVYKSKIKSEKTQTVVTSSSENKRDFVMSQTSKRQSMSQQATAKGTPLKLGATKTPAKRQADDALRRTPRTHTTVGITDTRTSIAKKPALVPKTPRIARSAPHASEVMQTPRTLFRTPSGGLLKPVQNTQKMKKRKSPLNMARREEIANDSSPSELMEIDQDRVQFASLSQLPMRPPTESRKLITLCVTTKDGYEKQSRNTRNAPSKTGGRFFKRSPDDRMKKMQKNKPAAGWLDDDSLFGFEC